MNLSDFLRAFGSMLGAPVRIRRHPPKPPTAPGNYQIPPLAENQDATTIEARSIPIVKTPLGGWQDWPPLVLAECDEPLVGAAPDLRGMWQVHRGPLKGHIERVEQAGERVVITAGGVIHDMFVDGTLVGGVNDIGEGGAHVSVAARFENGCLNLYPGNRRVAVVTRYLDGDEMVWRWGPYRNRLRRIVAPDG